MISGVIEVGFISQQSRCFTVKSKKQSILCDMAISVSNPKLEARIGKAYAKMPSSVRPSSKNEFVNQLLDLAIDTLVREKIIVL